MPGRVGRPPKQAEGIGALVDSPQLFEADMRNFFRDGKPARLQRWFIASGSSEKAEQIATYMTLWFREKLASLLPQDEK